MSEYLLAAEPRTMTGKKVQAVRNQGKVPGVLYGKGTESVNLQFVARDLETVLRAAGTSNLVSLQIGEGAKVPVLLRDVQYDVIRHAMTHVDFMRVTMSEELTTDVGIVLVGETAMSGTVVQDLNSISVSCLPAKLPSEIEADLGLLESLDGTLMVKDLTLPDGVTVHADPEVSVVHVEYYQMPEEEEAETDETEMSPLVGFVSDDF